MAERRGAFRVLVGSPGGRRPLGSPRLGGRIILNCIFRKWGRELWTGLIWLRIGTGAGQL
jgi:hypothetical protein